MNLRVMEAYAALAAGQAGGECDRTISNQHRSANRRGEGRTPPPCLYNGLNSAVRRWSVYKVPWSEPEGAEAGQPVTNQIRRRLRMLGGCAVGVALGILSLALAIYLW